MISRLLAGGLVALSLALPGVAMAQAGRPILIAPNLRVTFVGITSGRLVVTGTTTPSTIVTLEQLFNVRSNARGDFLISVLHVSEDCIVDLSTRHGLGQALVAGCGPKGNVGAVGPTGATGPAGGVSQQGEWDSGTEYEENDIVFWRGSTWIATDAENLEEPGTVDSGWELFAQGGADGADLDSTLFAVVEEDGTWARGYPSGSGYESTRLGLGTYEVLFGQNNLRGCSFFATLGSDVAVNSYPPGFVVVVGRVNQENGVFVQTWDEDMVAADRGFHISVVCSPGQQQ